ncbi:uncharacterized protein LOC119674885 [Teleopsis dalmanni]|uniref:uncharacterized protein LOC119674885 n=1 Tax=Teleopsis dalmanni TaxID=139649 RepID=UPI0018CE7EDA|nr:uncharacterized protein LOC119674885 [Teleopsis dalmanni]
MSKIECLSVDKNLSEFEYCRLKPINRNVSEFSFKLKLHDTINDLTANYELLQKFNRYSPIGINYTLNICKYFTNRKNEKFVTIFFDLMNNYINLNHSCPFKDYIQLEKFYARHDRLPLPILSGEYLFKTSWFVKQKLRKLSKLNMFLMPVTNRVHNCCFIIILPILLEVAPEQPAESFVICVTSLPSLTSQMRGFRKIICQEKIMKHKPESNQG